MTDEEMYIENHRYLDAFFVLPLPTGRIAVLNQRREPFAIVEKWTDLATEGPKSIAQDRVVVQRHGPSVPMASIKLKGLK